MKTEDSKNYLHQLKWHDQLKRCNKEKEMQQEIMELKEENKKLKHKNELQEKALIKLCLKHHYDSIIIEWEEVIDMSNYKVVEKKKPQEEKLF